MQTIINTADIMTRIEMYWEPMTVRAISKASAKVSRRILHKLSKIFDEGTTGIQMISETKRANTRRTNGSLREAHHSHVVGTGGNWRDLPNSGAVGASDGVRSLSVPYQSTRPSELRRAILTLGACDTSSRP